MRSVAIVGSALTYALVLLGLCPDAVAGTLTSANYQMIAGDVNAGGFASMTSTASTPSIGEVGGSLGQSEALGLGSETGLDPESAAPGFWPIVAGELPSIDADGDGVVASLDNCPGVANPSQQNFDGDGEGDACDADDDGDGLPDTDEIARGTDPLDPDTDGDGWSDGLEVAYGSDPLDENSVPSFVEVPALPTWGLLLVAALVLVTGCRTLLARVVGPRPRSEA